MALSRRDRPPPLALRSAFRNCSCVNKEALATGPSDVERSGTAEVRRERAAPRYSRRESPVVRPTPKTMASHPESDRAEPTDDHGLAGTSAAWTPVGAAEPQPCIIRGSRRDGTDDTGQDRVVIEAAERDGLVDTARRRVEVMPT